MKNYSSQEINRLLAQLIESLADVLPKNKLFANDFYLYRWLIHNQMNVERTASRIRKSIEWRDANKLDELLDREFAFFAPGLEKEFVVDMEKFSSTGQPLTILNGDGINVRRIIQKYGTKTVLRYYFQMFAKMEKRVMDYYQHCIKTVANDANAHIDKDEDSNSFNLVPNYDPSWDSIATILILSYKDFSLLNATCAEGLQGTREGATVGMTFFPAMVSTVYFVNLNSFTHLVLKVLKPIISSEVMKLEFFDTDKSKWSKVLLEHDLFRVATKS